MAKAGWVQGFAAVIKTRGDELYAQAEKIALVLAPLNTHGVASLDEACPPAESLAPGAKARKSTTPPSMEAG